MPPITEKDFNKKMTLPTWADEDFFIPLGFNPFISGKVVGVGPYGKVDHWGTNNCWIPYEEPKKKVIKRMAPALFAAASGKYLVSTTMFQSEEAARAEIVYKFIKWPASEAMFVELEVEE